MKNTVLLIGIVLTALTSSDCRAGLISHTGYGFFSISPGSEDVRVVYLDIEEDDDELFTRAAGVFIDPATLEVVYEFNSAEMDPEEEGRRINFFQLVLVNQTDQLWTDFHFRVRGGTVETDEAEIGGLGRPFFEENPFEFGETEFITWVGGFFGLDFHEPSFSVENVVTESASPDRSTVSLYFDGDIDRGEMLIVPLYIQDTGDEDSELRISMNPTYVPEPSSIFIFVMLATGFLFSSYLKPNQDRTA